MRNGKSNPAVDADDVEAKEWLESLEWVIQNAGAERAEELLDLLHAYAFNRGVNLASEIHTPYLNTIPAHEQPPYPGSREIERRIKSLIRWNAMAMVVKANRTTNVGGHISTFASSATLYEVAFNHFFRAKTEEYGGDQVYFQGHAAPGMYARAFIEGRISEEQLLNFRQELAKGGGLSSYPHPWLMPDFWEFPTVSMGLGPIMSIYQARFNRYLENRGLKPENGGRVWAYLGDGETDEPESLGAITLAAREGLDNLVWVINCNLQRLDGPVRGNGKIIQELEGIFRGAGWNVIKVVWSGDWDSLLDRDEDGSLVRRMEEVVDGEYQKYSVSSGSYIREKFFGKYPQVKDLVEHLTDDQLQKLRRGGHDPEKVYAAYSQATAHKGKPTVILAKTVKGYGLGEAGEGKNITHSQKKMNDDELREFRSRFGIPLSDEEVVSTTFFRPDEKSPEMQYLRKRREELGGYMPARKVRAQPMEPPAESFFEEYYKGTGGREASTTMVFVRMLSKLLKDKAVGKFIVPIVPDEARTFGMEALFRQCGIYASGGQKYEPVDSDQLLYYREAKDGQILEEGINEAGSMSSFIAAGTAYATHGINTIPFFIYYSIFGFQRIGDLIWAAGDLRCRGFLLGGTAGRTTLNGEGLQHEDGHSHVIASTVPNCLAYDPTFSYEIATIIRDGMKRMYFDGESIFYYLTLQNEDYVHPKMPDGEHVREGILKGLYKFKQSEHRRSKLKANLFGSGSIMLSVIKAQEILENTYNVATNIWSVTSYTELRREAQDCERWNLLHPDATPKVPYVTTAVADEEGVFVAASDYMKILPDGISKWIPGGLYGLGTDGFGRSDIRERLRDHFEVDEKYIVLMTLTALADKGLVKKDILAKAVKDLGIDSEKLNPRTA